MKQFFLLLAFVFTAGALHAQGAKAPLQDVSGITASIVSKLTTNLGLTDTQKPRITTLVSNFLTQKAEIAPLQESNPNGYTKKLESMQHGLFNRFKTSLNADQYTKFLALKPPTNDITNVLCKLFY
ncbi:hypothetical protein DCC81_06940 [Chitinophaga parva]|uniref:Uncharacterized protein n=1 Tax=Chitinophaga parva TaxID=2169414 RepID=A0A2T7BNF0_9BACT|nr:hypothetical protein [Chitinophaga parva]PUZ29192.1 hypothetical protein DCC81_06940 [Chitinophaga parva]